MRTEHAAFQIFPEFRSYLPTMSDSRFNAHRRIPGEAGSRWLSDPIHRRVGTAALGLVLLVVGCGTARASAREADLIAEALALRAGMQVADVGAGNGRWSEELARRVGETGHVWATEVDEEEIEEIRDRVESAELGNVTPVLGDQQGTGLPDGCCDAILLRLVYHHFTEPEPMRASLRRALRPGGLIAVIDIVPQKDWHQLPGVPDRGGHGIAPAELIAEMTADGFEVAAEYERWDDEEDRFCIVFRRGHLPLAPPS